MVDTLNQRINTVGWESLPRTGCLPTGSRPAALLHRSKRDSLYRRILTNILLPIQDRFIRHDGFTRYLTEYDGNARLNREELLTLQLHKLNALLRHAWRTVPYLAQRWSAAGLADQPLASVEELQSYPLISKEEISSNYEAMISTAWRGRSLSKSTGGSTGVPFRFEYTRESDARRRAVMWRGYSWGGARLGDRCAYLWGVSEGLSAYQQAKLALYDRAYNRFVLNSFAMRQDNLSAYAARLRRIDPMYVVGFVNPLVSLSQWALENQVSLPRPQVVLTGAEALSGPQREIIASAFHAPVVNTYGCREVMLIASECRHGSLHWNADHLVVETVDAQGKDLSAAPGRVALTDLHNYAMPLVRYVNGDVAIQSASACACGLPFPTLSGVEGRVLDAIRTLDGRILPGEFFPHLFKDFPAIRQFQVVQHSLAALELNLVPNDSIPPAQMDRLMTAIRDRLGTTIGINVNMVSEIARTRSGKTRVTISMIGGGH